MKTRLIASFMVVLFATPGCKKLQAPIGNNWTFKSVTYKGAGCQANSPSLIAAATSQSGVPDSLFINFTGHLPDSTGHYMVENPNYPSFFCCPLGFPIWSVIEMKIGNTVYWSTGGNTANNQLYAEILSGNKLFVSASGIEMLNISVPGDSAALSFEMEEE